VWPFWQYLKGRDPDRMAPSEVRKYFTPSSPRPAPGPAIVITGKIPGFTRTTARQHAESLGYRVVSAVWSSVVAVWAGERPGKTHIKTAAARGVPIVATLERI
jgi:NAD-dependent DNA ligase